MRVTGIKELSAALKKRANLNDVKNVVKINGSELQRNMQRNAVFTKGYSTGATKRSIGIDITNGGFAAKVGPNTEYSPYLIYGTRYMAAQDFFRPSFYKQKQKFISDMKRLMG
ncbi:HK97 gp10 family phage protein [Halalkalibacterium halodurans]|uniref:HK97-gp10 family putative phage morphogenesis protein n=1 Tax=Halalkalibacterium halodurans TaxID=86665 RepID=UPI002E236E30|nr:HK97 gp10 family phage protein [Halalkalibacterium halodurans]MED4105509.1 HK97 gp10 family phage protein [Halalkalibacterium halodurans]MED4109285.1 HK97 gp10 family phage protein [Halalkalibacterium halodurans]MED4149701.1 HK97 gp10 family phage protein [Halalkalibacterium halodurans]